MESRVEMKCSYKRGGLERWRAKAVRFGALCVALWLFVSPAHAEEANLRRATGLSSGASASSRGGSRGARAAKRRGVPVAKRRDHQVAAKPVDDSALAELSDSDVAGDSDGVDPVSGSDVPLVPNDTGGIPPAVLGEDDSTEDGEEEEEEEEGVLELLNFPVMTKINVRSGFTFRNPTSLEKLDRWKVSTQMSLILFAPVAKKVGILAGLIGIAEPALSVPGALGTGVIADFLAVLQLEFHSLLHVWLGHTPVPADRTGISTPNFIAVWNYPGEITPGALPVGPKTETLMGLGGNNGGTLWGTVGGGTLKYYLGGYLQRETGEPLFSGRLNLALINPEPDYIHASQYYGERGDILALGASVQSQRYTARPGSTTQERYIGGNVDLLFEKLLWGGVLDIEGAYYRYEGEFERFDYSWFALGSYMFPFKVGPGAPQLLFRAQSFHEKATDAKFAVYDYQLTYVVLGQNVRAAFGYTRHENATLPGNGLFAGLILGN
jgi:hypothetical protein